MADSKIQELVEQLAQELESRHSGDDPKNLEEEILIIYHSESKYYAFTAGDFGKLSGAMATALLRVPEIQEVVNEAINRYLFEKYEMSKNGRTKNTDRDRKKGDRPAEDNGGPDQKEKG